MTLGTLFGTNTESIGLYGTPVGGTVPSNIYQTYFEWFIFKESSGQPATPTGGTWDFSANTGVPPTGWTNSIATVPLNTVWVSIAFVDSRNPTQLVWSDPGLLSDSSVYATAYADTFTGDGITTDWTLTTDPVTVLNMDVSINGVTQVPTTDFIVAGTLFSTTTPAPVGSVILVRYRQSLALSYYGAASNVQFTPYGFVSATDVQAAIEQVIDGFATQIDAANVSYTPAGTGAVTTNVQAKLRQTVSVMDFGAVGDGVTDDTAAVQNALDSGATVVDGNGLSCLINSSIEIQQNQTLSNISLTAGTAGMNMVLVNNYSQLINSSLIGTGTTNIVERGVYPAADGVSDVTIDADVSNLTIGIQSTSLPSIRPERWQISGYIHDIVGDVGVSEGYGVLLSPADACTITSKFKNIARHCVYVSAGSSYNDVNIDVDGCNNIAVQVYALASQPQGVQNRIRGSFRNLTQSFTNQGGAVGLIENVSQNDVSVQMNNSGGSTDHAIWVEGTLTTYPSGNNIHDCEISGNFTGGTIVAFNADATAIRNNRLYGNWVGSAILLTVSGSPAVNFGGYVEGNVISGTGAVGISNAYEVDYYVGPNYIASTATDAFIDYSTAKKRSGRIKTMSGIVRTASISGTSYADTVVTLPQSLSTTNRIALATLNGPVTGAPSDYTVNVFNTSATQITIRVYNGSGTATAFDVFWHVEGD